ncbi:hypothetical protein ACC689_35120, partial [Rhizobium ruizarguesonis]
DQDQGRGLYRQLVQRPDLQQRLDEECVECGDRILIAVGLAVCYRSNNWNIGAEGQFTIGAITGSDLPIVFYDWHSPLVLPLMLILGALGG